MLTYVILAENGDHSWDRFLYPFRAFEDAGEMRIRRWSNMDKDEIPALNDEIKKFLSHGISKTWQLICVNGYPVQEKEKIEEYMDFLKQIDSGLARYVHVIVLGTEIFNGRNRDEIFAGKAFMEIPSNYRLFYQETYSQEPSVADYDRLAAVCNILFIARNSWREYPLEYGFVHRITWRMDRKRMEEYLGKGMQKCNRMAEELERAERLIGMDHDGIGQLPSPIETTVSLGRSKKLRRFGKNRFPFLADRGEEDALNWRIRNDGVFEMVEKLREWPAGRWEREIATNRRVIVTDWEKNLYGERYLSREEKREFDFRKEKCAEAIFKMEFKTKERLDSVDRFFYQKEKMERAIRTRLDSESIMESSLRWLSGFCCIFLTFFLFILKVVDGENVYQVLKILLIVMVLFIIWFVLAEAVLHFVRIIRVGQLQMILYSLDKLINDDEESYGNLLEKIVFYKKCAFLEQQQRLLKQEDERKRDRLEYHKEQISLYSQFLEMVYGISGSEMKVSEASGFITGDDTTKHLEMEDYFAPGVNMPVTNLLNMGICFRIPYPFITDLKIQKYSFQKIRQEAED